MVLMNGLNMAFHDYVTLINTVTVKKTKSVKLQQTNSFDSDPGSTNTTQVTKVLCYTKICLHGY